MMPQIKPLTRNTFLSALTFSLVAAIVQPVYAHHDAGIIHACIKNGSIKIVGEPGACKSQEISVALATEAALQGGAGELETLVKRLHGRTVAVFERGLSGSGSDTGGPGGYKASLLFCDKDNLDPDPNNDPCTESNGIVAESPLITPADSGTVIRLDASNTPDFALMVEQITNGESDLIIFRTKFVKGDGSPAGGGSSGFRERTAFFGGNGAVTQVTSGPDYIDLEGLEVNSINIAVDFIFVDFDPVTETSNHAINYRVLFGIAP